MDPPGLRLVAERGDPASSTGDAVVNAADSALWMGAGAFPPVT